MSAVLQHSENASTAEVRSSGAPALDITVFSDTSAKTLQARSMTWEELCASLANPQHERSSKAACPLLKLATFGTQRTAQGSLRSDRNVVQVFGIEGDYDAEEVTIDQAADRLAAQGVAAFFYTSGSHGVVAPPHSHGGPRWRVLAPLSAPCRPEERRRYVGLLNAALGGILSTESFTLSQAFYMGRVRGAHYATRQVAGAPIDSALDLVMEPLFSTPTKERPKKEAPTVANVDDLDRAAAVARADRHTLADLASALRKLDPDRPRGWIDDGHALASLKGTPHEGAARRLWLAHIQRGAKHEPEDCDEWERLQPDRTDYRAIFARADAAGWVNPRKGTNPKKDAAPAVIEFIDFAAARANPPPARRWVVQEWLPRGYVTALFGRGGHGKSLAAQQLALAVACGTTWLGLESQRGPVVGLFCEDDADELVRRDAELLATLMIDADQVQGLHLEARAGKENVLMSFTRDHMSVAEPLMDALRAQCQALSPALVILDNAAQLFAGEENARTEVTQFCNALTSIAREFDCAVLLLGHLAKAEGSEYSGSTAWDAAVRSRLLLERQDDGTTRLRKLKANYSDRDELRLEYRSGAFVLVPPAQGASPETLAAIKPLIVSAIERYTNHQQAVSHLTTARNHLVRLMKDDGLLGGLSETLVRAALGAMLDAQEVAPNQALPWKDASRHVARGLVIAEKAS